MNRSYFPKSHGELCHFTPPNRRVQRKPREAKEVQRLLQDRLERAEALLRQAGIRAPSTDIQNGIAWTMSAPSEPQSLDAEYSQSPPLDREASMTTHRLSGIRYIPTHDQSNRSLTFPFQQSRLPFGNVSVINTETREATLTPHGRNAVAVSYVNTSQPSATPPDTQQINPKPPALELKGTPSSTQALQLDGGSMSVHENEATVSYLAASGVKPPQLILPAEPYRRTSWSLPPISTPAPITNISRARILLVNLQQSCGRVGFETDWRLRLHGQCCDSN